MLRTLLATLLAVYACGNAGRPYVPRDGDIVFQTSRSSQSSAIQRATRSRYSHMGVVFIRDGKPFVYEAVQPVKLTPLSTWIQRGKGGHFVARRLRDADRVLTPTSVGKLEQEGQKYRGRNYDLYFEWSDDRMYCSELVWKMYDRALGVQLGELQRLSEFDLSDPVVKAKMRERWHGSPPPNEIVISPASMFESARLVTAYSQ